MRFSELLNKLSLPLPQYFEDFEINKLSLDSRNIENNDIFFAIKGTDLNGENYIGSAIEQGAKAVFVGKTFASSQEIKNLVSVKNPNKMMHNAITVFYPNIPQNIIAITGTNGKTSVANFIAQILTHLSQKAFSVGTLGFLKDGDFNNKFSESSLTSPDVITLHQNLSKLKEGGYNHAVIEASSHGLHQNRFGDLKFDICAFTNFSQDHLDYHKTMGAYFAAKKLLFTNFSKPSSKAILNADITQFQELENTAQSEGLEIIDYGKKAKKLKVINYNLQPSGIEIEFSFMGDKHILNTQIFGAFQVENIACAISCLVALGFEIEQIIKAAKQLKPVKGRMEVIQIPVQNATAIIDYAHTPDALEKAIQACQKHNPKKLITVFGCGGDRDKAKRAKMGKIANHLSDEIIVTDDNPRTENAQNIRAEIISACPNAIEIQNRKAAILTALQNSKSGDIILIAGKGHEDYQIIGTKKHHFSDSEIVEEFIREGA